MTGTSMDGIDISLVKTNGIVLKRLNKIFYYKYSSETKKILVRDVNDPFKLYRFGRGPINIIDLANINSCSFIATDDYGIINSHGFNLLGRLDESDLRGCNQMLI